MMNFGSAQLPPTTQMVTQLNLHKGAAGKNRNKNIFTLSALFGGLEVGLVRGAKGKLSFSHLQKVE